MKAKMTNAKQVAKERKYPYIGYSKQDEYEFYVLFIEPSTGVCIVEDRWPIGHYSDAWSERDFTPFDGEITLSND